MIDDCEWLPFILFIWVILFYTYFLCPLHFTPQIDANAYVIVNSNFGFQFNIN